MNTTVNNNLKSGLKVIEIDLFNAFNFFYPLVLLSQRKKKRDILNRFGNLVKKAAQKCCLADENLLCACSESFTKVP